LLIEVQVLFDDFFEAAERVVQLESPNGFFPQADKAISNDC